MNKPILIWAGFFGALSVALGAFAAHGLRTIFPSESIALVETAVRYQFYHVFALFAAAILAERFSRGKFMIWAARCFIIGILLFSGSLYLLAAIKAGTINVPEAIGIITPFGGLSLIAGWILLIVGVLKG
jgi:uncharacterized membrane protein YgdD (TMEM256/DUF423 family)